MSPGTHIFWAQTSTMTLATLFFCIQIVWIIRYWLHRKQDFVAVRECIATLFVCIGACSYQIWTILCILWGIWRTMCPGSWHMILTAILYSFIVGGCLYTFMYKSWMLWYNASLNDALTDIEWKVYISKQNRSTNWFIANETKYGNPKYVLSFTLFLLFLSSVVGIIPFHYESIQYKLIFLISTLFPFIVIGIIAYKIYCVDDIFKIKNEITIYYRLCAPSLLSLYILLFCVQSTDSYIYLIFLLIPSISLFLSVYFQTAYVIRTFQHSMLGHGNTAELSHTSQKRLTLNVLHSNSPKITTSPISHQASHTKDHNTPSSVHYQHTPSGGFNITPFRSSPTVVSLDISGAFPDITELKQKPSIKLIDVIQDAQWFGLFIRHITKEFAFENLLYIIETVQFQQRLTKELENEHTIEEETAQLNAEDNVVPLHIRSPTITDEINNVQSKTHKFKLKQLILPCTVPRSQIVFGDCQNWLQYLSHIVLQKKPSTTHDNTDVEAQNTETNDDNAYVYDPYKQSVLIYNKYLKSTGVLTVNISSEERKRFDRLFEINQNDQDKKEKIYLLSKTRLIDIWEETQLEVWNLLSSSFRRFKKTPVFTKMSSER